MKNKVFTVIILSILAVYTAGAQPEQKNLNPVGEWSYAAPYAPEGYQSGSFTVAFSDKQYTVGFGVAGSDYKVPGEKVKFENNTFTFLIFLEGQQIDFILKMDTEKKMTGKATYSEGDVPLTLTRIEKK